MKRFLLLLLVFIVTSPLQAARVEISHSSGLAQVALLSAGTMPVLDHLRQNFATKVQSLDRTYRIADLEKEIAAAATLLDERRQAYADTIESTRSDYLAKLSLKIIAAESFISPESSALGEISFTYTITNNSDRIISDLVYAPRIGMIKLPTSSRLILELSNPDTLKFGLQPGRTISIEGHKPERFSFFIGELSPDQLAFVRSHIEKKFHIDIVDLHFVDRIGYKGQSTVMDVKTAFSAELERHQTAVAEAERLLDARTLVHRDKNRAYTRRKKDLEENFARQATDLKKSSIRFTAPSGDKNKAVFDDVTPGNYLVYAPASGGQALVQTISVPQGKTRLDITTLAKDPFTP